MQVVPLLPCPTPACVHCASTGGRARACMAGHARVPPQHHPPCGRRSARTARVWVGRGGWRSARGAWHADAANSSSPCCWQRTHARTHIHTHALTWDMVEREPQPAFRVPFARGLCPLPRCRAFYGASLASDEGLLYRLHMPKCNMAEGPPRPRVQRLLLLAPPAPPCAASTGKRLLPQAHALL